MSTSSSEVYVQYVTDLSVPRVAITKSTYKLGGYKSLFGAEEIGATHRRCPWNSCFREAFDPEFTRFMDLETSLGTLLGCVARIYLAQYEGITTLDSLDRTFFINNTDSSYGRGFIHTVRTAFPELSSQNSRTSMEECLNSYLSNANRELEGSFSLFKKHCGCSSCAGSGRTENYGCFMGLAATIVDLV
jgi:hypothetical protein